MTADQVKKMLDNQEPVYFQNTQFHVFGHNGKYQMNVIEVIAGELCPQIVKLSIKDGEIRDSKTGDLFNPNDFFGDPKFVCVVTNKGIKNKFFIFDEELYNKNIGRLKAEGMKVRKKGIGNDFCRNYAVARFSHLQLDGYGMLLC